MSNYPAQIDTSQSLPTVADNLTPVQAIVFNRLRCAVVSIEAELGIKPSSVYGNVRNRLDILEKAISAGGGGGGGGVNLAGDLGNTEVIPLVIGIQGRPVANISPTSGQALIWDGAEWTPTTISFESISLAQDLGNTDANPFVIGIQGRSVLNNAPTTGQALVWNGSAWQPEDVVVVTVFDVTLAGGGLVEVGQTVVNPSFTATYTATPTSVTFSDSNGGSQSVSTSSPANFNSNFSFTENTFGASVTFTLTAIKGSGGSKTASVVEYWGQKNYFGVGVAGGTGASFITSLSGNSLQLSRAESFTVTAGSSQKIYFSCRSAYGQANFTVGGFAGGFSYTGTYSVTNGHGFTENYDLYESDNLGLGTTTVQVS